MMVLIGFTTPDTAQALKRQATRIDGASLTFLTEGEIVAVLASLPRPPLRLFTRRSGLKDLVRMQRILEAILPHGPLLAARPGTRADDERALRSLLITEHDRLVEALRLFGQDVQFQVTVLWDSGAVLTRAASDPDLRSDVAAAARGSADASARMRAHVRALRDGLQTRLQDLIAPAVQGVVMLPLDGEDMVANMTVRIRRDGEAALEAALQPLDALLPGNSRIKLVGPLPALSFAAVHIEHADRDNIAEARRLLGVSANATLAELRASYYRVAQDHHPDLVTDIDGADIVGAASRAYKLLKRIAVSAERREDHCTFLDIVRPDDTVRRAA
jgi:hypothetical protein